MAACLGESKESRLRNPPGIFFLVIAPETDGVRSEDDPASVWQGKVGRPGQLGLPLFDKPKS